MYGLATRISNLPEHQLAIASIGNRETLQHIRTAAVQYYLLPRSARVGYSRQLEDVFQSIDSKFQPDLVHIHGTEYPIGLACMRACPHLPYVVSIQGLTGANAAAHFGGLSGWSIARHITLRDLLRRDSIWHSRRTRRINAPFERECLRRATIVSGRTAWDKSWAARVAPTTPYEICQESLRDEFYDAPKWSSSECKPYTLFMSQAHSPLKGLHQVLPALANLKHRFPTITLRIAGKDILNTVSFRSRVAMTGYGQFIAHLTRQLQLQNTLEFLGPLGESEMIHEFRRAHAFLCPSAIENSPNSVGEAQILGAPVIASNVGGIPDMIQHGETGLLYPFGDRRSLATLIERIFLENSLARTLSQNEISVARTRHDRLANLHRMLEIYEHAYDRCQ